MAAPPPQASAPHHPDLVAAVNFVAEAGAQMLASSTSVSEVVVRLRQLLAALGLGECSVDATLSSITLSYWTPELPWPITTMRDVNVGQPRLERLAGTGALIDSLERGEIDLDEAYSRLRALEARPGLRRRYANLAVMLSVAGWVVFLDGWDAITIVVALLATIAALPIGSVVVRLRLPIVASTFLVALVIAAIPNLLGAAGVPVRVGPAVVGALFIYLPGRALVSSVIDSLANAPMSAMSRGLEAIVTAGALALGMLAGSTIGEGFGLAYKPNADAQPLLMSVLAAGVAVLGLAAAWGMPRGQLLPASATAALGWFIVAVSAGGGNGPDWAAYGVAALVVGLVGVGLSVVQGAAASVYTGVAILPLVPGYALYQGMLAISQGRTEAAVRQLSEAALISISIAIGVAVGLALGQILVRISQRSIAPRRA